MSLLDHVRIARRFLRSTRIDTDLDNPNALDGFVCPQSSANVLTTMARHVAQTGQGAFTWTGPYGSGKSSLVVALGALLDSDNEVQTRAANVLGRELASAVRAALPTGKRGWRILPIVGRRSAPVKVIGEAMRECGFVTRRPRGGWNETNLIAALKKIATEERRTCGGLIVFIDEMGKFLEAAAQDGSDIFVLQELAEAASRCDGRLLVVGVLHQAFEEYTHRLSREMRDEWAKIQGRYIDLVVDSAAEEQIDLIGRAIESDHDPDEPSKTALSIASAMRNGRKVESTQFARKLEACWPLHPVVACLLGPISRRRFGQNQRSIFGFLNSSELYGFQDFLGSACAGDVYSPDRLWDYLRANLEPSILASPDGHRWALAVEAVERCEAKGGDELHLKILKSIAVLDLFKERSGLVPSFDVLRACIPSITKIQLNSILADLDRWSLTIYKKFLGGHAIFAGSDFDVEEALRTAIQDVDEVDFVRLNALAGLQPVLAKRHYHETGAMRWFEVNILPLSSLCENSARHRPANGAIGQFLLAIPTGGETTEKAEALCRKAARQSESEGVPFDVVVGVSRRSWAIIPLARELFALDSVLNDHPSLHGDDVARREVSARLADVQAMLEAEIYDALDNAKWFRKYHSERCLRQADLNGVASELADNRFPNCPRLHNELLNREQPSSNAIAAQNQLLKHMVQDDGTERLGIDGFPAHGGLFASILEATGLYGDGPNGWQFLSPLYAEDDPSRLRPLWAVALEYVEGRRGSTVAVSEIYEIWRRPPYGVKKGLMPILAVAFLLSHKDKLAAYRDGVFRARIEDIDVEYLTQDAGLIQFRWMDLGDLARNLLSRMADVVQEVDCSKPLTHLEPIDVARGLVGIFDELPSWTKRTMRLSVNAMSVRDLLKRACDPNKLLFDDIPAFLGEGDDVTGDESLDRVVCAVREGLDELVQAYPDMLQKLRTLMLDELQVPNDPNSSLAVLRDRAENIRHLAGDFRLDAFVGRLAQLDDSIESFEGMASLAGNKPPRSWVDPDHDRAAISLAELAQQFLRAEMYARVKDRPDKRQALAVVVGMDGRPGPLIGEFAVADSDRGEIDNLISRLGDAVESADPRSRDVILAALAELSARYIEKDASEARVSRHDKATRV